MSLQPYYVPDFLVKIEGLTLEADITSAVISLSYDNNIDTADMFTLQINNADLRFTDSALFEVGKNVEIYMGYVGNLQAMMLGEITAVNPSFPASGAPMLTVTGYDKSHRMRHNSPSRNFIGINDSAIAAQIAAENLLIPIVDPTPMPPGVSFPQTSSDWALLKKLADRNYFQVYVYWDKLYFRFPRPQTEMVVLEWGKNLSSFNPRLSTSGQAGIQVVRGYDEQLAQKIVAILPVISISSDLDNLLERLGSEFLEQLVKLGRHVVRDQPVSNYLEATTLAKSLLKQLLEGLYEGSGNCIGIPELRAGNMVEIKGIGKRFSGKYTLSRVTHTIDQGGYQTQFEVSQKFNTNLLQSLRTKIAESPSPNRPEKINGVVMGIVKNIIDIPQGLGRVQLHFPHISDHNLSAPARIATLMAGADRGTYFVPELEDHVLVAFEQGDIKKPVVIGSLWHGRARPPEANNSPSYQNYKKVIQTKSGMKLTFDETPEQENLALETASGSVIKIDDLQSQEKISLQWQGGNPSVSLETGKISLKLNDTDSIELSEQEGINIVSSSSIKLSVGENNSLEISAEGVKIQGQTIELN